MDTKTVRVKGNRVPAYVNGRPRAMLEAAFATNYTAGGVVELVTVDSALSVRSAA